MFITPENSLYWHAALRLPNIGPVTFRRWLNSFADIKELFSASINDLQYAGLNEKEINLLKNPDWKKAENDLRVFDKSNCHLLTFQDKAYPSLLKEIHDAPLLLFVRGNVELLSKPQVAIVGSRNPTTTGYETAEQFARELAKSGLIITSGMALGIDSASHWGALSVGTTIAIMGTGLNHVYPRSNQKLAAEISEKGALISEFPLDDVAKPVHFPMRNRIISGLSSGVLVVEAALKSGSLITAHTALEQGREIFAIPGSIHNPLARGCHYLLRQGAKLVETAADIVEELSPLLFTLEPNSHAILELVKPHHLDEKQLNLLNKVGFETTSFDAIIVRSGLTSSEVSSILLSLELKGYVQTVSGGYARSSRQLA